MVKSIKWLGLPFLLTAFLLMALACGPVAQPDQEPLGNVIAPPQQDNSGTEGESSETGEEPTNTPSPTATPTPLPTSCAKSPFDEGPEMICFQDTGPNPTPKYPRIGDATGRLEGNIRAAEESRAARQAAGNDTDPAQIETERVHVIVYLDSNSDEDAVASWMKANSVGYSRHTAARGEVTFIAAPTLLQVGPLSELEGVRFVFDAGPVTPIGYR